MDYDEDEEYVDYDDAQNALPEHEEPEEDEIALWEDIDENEIHDIMSDDYQGAEQQPNPIQADPEEVALEEVVEEEEEEVDDELVEQGGPIPPEEEDEEEEEADPLDREEEPARRYPIRERTPVQSYAFAHVEHEAEIDADADHKIEYDEQLARVIATILCHYRDMNISKKVTRSVQFATTYSLKQAMKRWGRQADDAAKKEMQQLLDRECWIPIHRDTITPSERKRIMKSLLFLVEKRDGTKKARHCADGSIQRDWISSDDSSSPTVHTESVLLTAVIDAYEGRDVMTADVPNAFIQTELEKRDKDGNRTIMKIRGELVDILCSMDDQYREYVVYERGEKCLYVWILKAIYGLLVSALLFYKKFRASIESLGFKVNPYDPCVANKTVKGKQATVLWHVDDLKASCVDSRFNDGLHEWLNKEYGTVSEVKVNRTKIHDYLGLTLDYSEKGKVKIDMRDYVKGMVSEFDQEDFKGPRVANPASENLFRVDSRSAKLSTERAERFRSFVLKSLFLAKRGRPDVLQATTFLCTRCKVPTVQDWGKLVRKMKFLRQTMEDVLTLSADGSGIVRWYVDAAFAVHDDMKSHSGGNCTLGQGAVISGSKKQKMNTRSSTEAEIVGRDDFIGPMLWTRYFLENQSMDIKDNICFQDNESSIRLGVNGRASATKRSRHLDIRFFYMKDLCDKKLVTIKYCPTDEMDGDFQTKPLQGKKYHRFRRRIMGMPPHPDD